MSVTIPKPILDWNPRVVPIQKGRKGPTVPKWTETQVRAKDIEFGPDDDKYGIVLDADTLVIDVDVHDPAKNGYAALERLSKDCGVDLLDVAAFVVESPSGGRHLYFSKASDLKLPKSTQQYAGLDFLSEGCQVIGAGSTHVDGGEYLPALLRQCGFGADGYADSLPDIEVALGSKASGVDISESYPQLTLAEMEKDCPERRPYVIEGLLRQGETMNIVASPKTGKSWFIYNLVITLANGGDFLGWTSPSNLNCLLVDNELHQEELVWRLRKVEKAIGAKAGKSLRVSSLRGSGLDISGLEAMMAEIGASQYDVIVLDALYRFLPEGTSENDNAQMMAIYNALDRIGRIYGCSIIVVHHASKGEQSGKSITDIGAGAGSITRAADSQVVLLPHEVEGLICVEAFCRSSITPEPFSAVLEDGKWRRLEGIKPERQKSQAQRKKEAAAEKREAKEDERLEKLTGRAEKVRQWFSDNEKFNSEQAEEVFGEAITKGQVTSFMRMLRFAGVTDKPWMGWHRRTDGWEEQMDNWIANDCPKGE